MGAESYDGRNLLQSIDEGVEPYNEINKYYNTQTGLLQGFLYFDLYQLLKLWD